MKRRTLVGIMIGVGVALVVAAVVLYWQICRPWQHLVNLDHQLQSKIAIASPHDSNRRNSLAQMPAGRRTIEGVRFNVAGLIQLANGNDAAQPANPYPVSVEDIPVKRTFHQLHLLHGAAHSAHTDAAVASVVLHYADGTTSDVDIVYGQQVYDWWFKGKGDVSLADNTKTAWIGANPAAAQEGFRIRVFMSTFNNPKPGVRVLTADFVSKLTPCAPFMIALTVE